MRNSGNDFMWSHFRDAAIQLTCYRGGMDLDWQAYQPTIWYLNGAYMGITNLRERSNEDHTYSNYNKLEDIDMFENWKELTKRLSVPPVGIKAVPAASKKRTPKAAAQPQPPSLVALPPSPTTNRFAPCCTAWRSEERRVGKEC